MKFPFLFMFVAVLSISSVSAKTIALDVTDELTYSEIVAYNDGAKAITFPKMYGYFLAGAYRGDAANNAAAICLMLGSSNVLDYSSYRTGRGSLKIVFLKTENNDLSQPRFGYGGEYETTVLSKVLCR